MTNYNFNSIKFNLEYGLGGKPVSRGLFQFYQFSLIPCQATKITWQATKITWQELFLCALLILIIKRHHHIRQLLLRFFQSSCPFIHRNHISSSDSISAVSSPQTNAPAPALMVILQLKSVPRMFSPK